MKPHDVCAVSCLDSGITKSTTYAAHFKISPWLQFWQQIVWNEQIPWNYQCSWLLQLSENIIYLLRYYNYFHRIVSLAYLPRGHRNEFCWRNVTLHHRTRAPYTETFVPLVRIDLKLSQNSCLTRNYICACHHLPWGLRYDVHKTRLASCFVVQLL